MIGMLLVMFLMEDGVKKLLVIGNKEIQRQRILGLGNQKDNYCDSSKQNAMQWIMEHTEDKGADRNRKPEFCIFT